MIQPDERQVKAIKRLSQTDDFEEFIRWLGAAGDDAVARLLHSDDEITLRQAQGEARVYEQMANWIDDAANDKIPVVAEGPRPEESNW